MPGISVPDVVVVLLCVLGAGAVVTAIAAFSRSIFREQTTDAIVFNQRSLRQDAYLRAVREVNLVEIWSEAKAERRERRRRQAQEARDFEMQRRDRHGNVGRQQRTRQHIGGRFADRGQVAPVAYYEEGGGYDVADEGHTEDHNYRPEINVETEKYPPMARGQESVQREPHGSAEQH